MPAPTAAAPPTRLAAIVFGVLVVATFGAFFLASRLKAEPPVLRDMTLMPYFSPNGDGRRDVEVIEFRAALDDQAAVDIVDADGARVRRLGEDVRIRRGETTVVRWDGREDDGSRAPDGEYRMRLTLRSDGRSILAGRAFFVDTEAPEPAVIVDPTTPIVAPGQPVPFKVRGTGMRFRPTFQVLRTDVTPARTIRRWRGEAHRVSFTWDGRDQQGKPVPPGTYLIAVTTRDRAGNVGTGPKLPPRPGAVEGRPGVTVRALAVQPPVRAARAGGLAAFRVDARGRSYRWSVRRLGTGRPVVEGRRPKRGTTLLVRAPKGPSGVYLLEVRSHGARTSVPFAVQSAAEAPRRRPLVVLPVIGWLGRDPVDDSRAPNGLPDTLATGSSVSYPRLYAYPGGLPTGFARDVAPLLVWMDRNHIRYDVTTDLALSLTPDQPQADVRRGLLFAGPSEWVSRGLARRLRRYVAEGGRVALFGPHALRAGVTVGDHQLTRPTVAGPTDAFGGRIADVRRLRPGPDGAVPPLSVLQDDPDLGLLEGFGGRLTAFTQVEELVSAGPHATEAAQVGEALTDAEALDAEQQNRTQRAALSAVRVDKGVVIRIGLPEWVRRLNAGDAAVSQITHNVVDVLRGERPRARSAG